MVKYHYYVSINGLLKTCLKVALLRTKETMTIYSIHCVNLLSVLSKPAISWKKQFKYIEPQTNHFEDLIKTEGVHQYIF